MLHHSADSRRLASLKKRRANEAGFIVTLELLVLFAIFAVVIYFALYMAQKWLISLIDPIGGKHVVVYDSDGTFITRTNSFVGHEAPIRVYRVPTHEAAILGTRAELNGGFTTGQRLYYSDSTTCSGTTLWILDPTTAAGAATQFLEWDDGTGIDPTPDDTGYGHPVSDFYTMQTIAFAMGPDGVLYRAHGSESTDPPLTPGYDPTVFGYPASEWDSERYDAGRCRRIGPVTTIFASANDEQKALVPYMMQVDNSYLVRDNAGNPYSPNFWVPTQYNNQPPPVMVDSENPGFFAPATETAAPQGTGPVSTNEGSPAPVVIPVP